MKLSKFLKKHKAYKQFKNNFNAAYNGYEEGDSVSIIDAFKWNHSLEGYYFWSTIDDGWEYNIDKKKYDLIVKNNKLKKNKGY